MTEKFCWEEVKVSLIRNLHCNAHVSNFLSPVSLVKLLNSIIVLEEN